MKWLSAGLAIIFLVACEPTDQSSPKTLQDGARTISKNMVGFWDAPGGSRCRWWIQSPRGQITNGGNTTGPVNARRQKKGPASDMSQTMLIGGGNVGETIKSDKCGPWKKR